MQPATVLVYVILFCDICGVSVLCVSTVIIAIFMYFSILKCLFTAIYIHYHTDTGLYFQKDFVLMIYHVHLFVVYVVSSVAPCFSLYHISLLYLQDDWIQY